MYVKDFKTKKRVTYVCKMCMKDVKKSIEINDY